MASWSEFVSAISTIPKGIGAVGKSLTGGGEYLSEDEKEKAAALNATMKATLGKIDSELEQLPAYKLAKVPAKVVGDLMLQAAVTAQQKVISPFIMRPLSTYNLLTDTNSPLYKKGEYEEGFQFNDIKSAYNRSAKVSLFQAMTKSDANVFMKPLSSIILSTGDIDLDEVDLWSDESIKKNYVDNAVGRWFTGIGDFATGSLATFGAGRVITTGAKFGARKVGINTSRKTIAELDADMQTGIEFTKSGGVSGTQTVSGSHVNLLAESKDYGIISDIVGKYSTNGKLLPLVYNASTPEAVKDLLLADKGYLPAIERLAKTAPDDLFDLGDVAAQITNKVVQTGKSHLPTGPEAIRLKAAYDAAIKRDPQFLKIRQAFFDDEYELTPGGRSYMPMEPKVGASALIRAQEYTRNVKNKARFREFDNDNFFMSTKLGNKIVTEFVRQVGTRMPTGYVTFSGVRPLEGRIELNAFLDNLSIFKNGSEVIDVAPGGVKDTVANVRRQMENEYMASIGVNQIEALKKIDVSVGRLIGYKAGIFDDKTLDGYTAAFRSNIETGLSSLKANGYAVGHDGRRIETDSKTLRQLEESYRFTPWESIERKFDIELKSNKGQRAYKNTSDLFNQIAKDATRVWTFDVLVRPMYITKQSIGEPLLSATLSQGIDFIFKDVINNPLSTNGMFGRLLRNTGNMTAQVGVRAATTVERKAINKFVTQKREMLVNATIQKDLLQVEVERLLRPGGSPAVKRSALTVARKELEAAERLLDKVELDLRAAVVPYGKVEALPTLTMLERRVNFLKSKPSLSKANSQKLSEAEQAIDNYKDVIDKMATKTTVIRDADTALAAAYNAIDEVVGELKPALKKEADVWGKNAQYKKRYYSREKKTIVLNGEVHLLDTFTGENAPYAAAMRAETSNGRTSEINALGEQSVGTRAAILKRRIPTDTIKVTDATYFEELAHVANRFMREDPLIDLILAGKSIKELKTWASSESGIRYLENFDIYEQKQVPAYLADKIGLVERMFPSEKVRATILEREVTATELQGMLANNVDELYDIVPTNFAYGVADAGLGAEPYKKFGNLINNATAGTFRFLGSFENPIRNAMFERLAFDALKRKAQVLVDQGIKMTPGQWNALRQSAGREAIQELEKTVYTVRRENRLLHNARMIAAFPTATANAFYRYGRIAANNPERSLTFLNDYARLFQNFGVDENGNPTKDISKMTHVVIPGTKELGIGGDDGMMLNSRSLGFLLNAPSPSYITSLSVGNIMKSYPGADPVIKDILNVAGFDGFEYLFPYGAPTNVKDAFIPPWAKSLNKSIVADGKSMPKWALQLNDFIFGDQGRADYLSSYTAVYDYHKMLVELGIEKKFPSEERLRTETKELWAQKFRSSFASISGIPYKVETNKMRLTDALYYKMVERNKYKGMTEQDARDAAGLEMLTTMGPGFMIDRVTKTSNSRNLYGPATYESYKRVFEDNDELVGKLAAIDSDDIGIVSLLTADLSRNPEEESDNIRGILQDPNLVLPGTNKRISNYKLTAEQAEAERLKQRTTSDYFLVREALEAKITDGRTLRSHPELKAVLDNLVETTFKEQSQAWYDDFKMAEYGDKSYKYARAFQVVLEDKNYMKKNGNSQYWQDVQVFMDLRNMAAMMYQSLPAYDKRKALIKDAYNDHIEKNVDQWDPNLRTTIKYYLSNDNLKVVQ